MTQDRVMLLIDADNVSVDVVEQAVSHLLQAHGALHVRRAYCTAESALKHQAVFRRLSIKPMVNLSTGKNATDIALAVDAMDLVLAERPDVVAIASSDSDFAPLVARLREKGCRVVGIGQEGKTGDETLQVYDEFTVMAHRKARAGATAQPAGKTPARSAAKTAARSSAPSKPAAKEAPAAHAPAAAPAKAGARATAKAPARKVSPRRSAKVAAAAPTQLPAAAAAAQPPAAAAPAQPPAAPVPDPVRQMLDLLPELLRGDTVALRVASVRLREAGLLNRSGSSTKLFGQFPDRFELVPAGNPNHVRLLARATKESPPAQTPTVRGFGRGAS